MNRFSYLFIPIVQNERLKGIRIPQKIIKRLGLEPLVNATVTDTSITISPSDNPREGWEEDFKRCHKDEQDALLIPEGIDADNWDNL
jgi:antitoxin component of MazEF toxin-antitoxin module